MRTPLPSARLTALHGNRPSMSISHSMRRAGPAAFALLLIAAATFGARAASLTVEDDAARIVVDTADLLARPDATEVTIPADIAYGGTSRRYRAVPLTAILDLLPNRPPPGAVLEARATDGFAAQVPLSLVRPPTPGEPSAWLAIEPSDVPWPNVSGRQASAGPFYIVWERAAAGRISPEYWPYQIAALRIVEPPAVRWPEIAVDAALPVDHRARRGQEVYTAICLACHRMNGGGAGEMGPDLNRPMNPTEYFQPEALRRLLRDPASVRTWPEQKMPGYAEAELSNADLDAVIAYLAQMAAQRPVGSR